MPAGEGLGIALQAQAPDRVEQLNELAAKKAQFVADAAKRQKEYDQKRKDQDIEKLGADLDRIDYSKFDDLMQPSARQSATNAYTKLVNEAIDARTPEELQLHGSKIVNDLKAELGALQVAGKNYQNIRTTDDSKLDVWGKTAKYAVSQDDIDKTKKIMDNAPANPFGTFYDPNTGAMALPWQDKKQSDWSDLFKKQATSGNDYMFKQAQSFNVDATKYDEMVGHLPLTDVEAQQYAKKNGIPFIPASIESMTRQFVANNPDGAQTWLHNQFMTEDDYKSNIKTYFNDDGTPKQDVINKGYADFIKQGIISQQKYPEKYLSGRPESQAAQNAKNTGSSATEFQDIQTPQGKVSGIQFATPIKLDVEVGDLDNVVNQSTGQMSRAQKIPAGAIVQNTYVAGVTVDKNGHVKYGEPGSGNFDALISTIAPPEDKEKQGMFMFDNKHTSDNLQIPSRDFSSSFTKAFSDKDDRNSFLNNFDQQAEKLNTQNFPDEKTRKFYENRFKINTKSDRGEGHTVEINGKKYPSASQEQIDAAKKKFGDNNVKIIE